MAEKKASIRIDYRMEGLAIHAKLGPSLKMLYELGLKNIYSFPDMGMGNLNIYCLEMKDGRVSVKDSPVEEKLPSGSVIYNKNWRWIDSSKLEMILEDGPVGIILSDKKHFKKLKKALKKLDCKVERVDDKWPWEFIF